MGTYEVSVTFTVEADDVDDAVETVCRPLANVASVKPQDAVYVETDAAPEPGTTAQAVHVSWSALREPERPPLNGYRLLFAVTETAASTGKVSGHYVVVERSEDVHDRYVCAYVRDITDPTWNWGDYCTTASAALASALQRAGWGDQTYVSLPAERL